MANSLKTKIFTRSILTLSKVSSVNPVIPPMFQGHFSLIWSQLQSMKLRQALTDSYMNLLNSFLVKKTLVALMQEAAVL